MIPIYTNAQLFKERDLVSQYLRKRAKQKNYPQSYEIALEKFSSQLYELCRLSPNELVLNDCLVQQACLFAQEKHSEQTRKFTYQPYILHPLEMACVLSQIPEIEPEAMAAALLHDVVEDCGVSLQEIEKKFGLKVAQYVYYLTDPAKPEDGNRAVRMDINFAHFKQAPFIVKNIKMTDLLSNSRSIVLCDANFALVYVPTLERTTQYLKENQNIEAISLELLNKLTQTTELSKKLVNIQTEFCIIKKDKKKSFSLKP